MKLKQYDIPYADIPRGIELSLKNSDRLRTDAEILAEKKRYNSAIPLITLAAEEFGKALWLSEYFEKNASIPHNEACPIFRSHRKRIDRVLDYVENIVKTRTIKTIKEYSEDNISNIPEEFDEQDFKERMWYVDYKKIQNPQFAYKKQSWKNPLYVEELAFGNGYNTEFSILYYKYHELRRSTFYGIRKFRESPLYEKILSALPPEEFSFEKIISYIEKHFLLKDDICSIVGDELDMEIYITPNHSWITPSLADMIKEHLQTKYQVKQVRIILESFFNM